MCTRLKAKAGGRGVRAHAPEPMRGACMLSFCFKQGVSERSELTPFSK